MFFFSSRIRQLSNCNIIHNCRIHAHFSKLVFIHRQIVAPPPPQLPSVLSSHLSASVVVQSAAERLRKVGSKACPILTIKKVQETEDFVHFRCFI
jgi:hypothetical protein